jgi:hypothetical protein
VIPLFAAFLEKPEEKIPIVTVETGDHSGEKE